jgi:hypothetical protein
MIFSYRLQIDRRPVRRCEIEAPSVIAAKRRAYLAHATEADGRPYTIDRIFPAPPRHGSRELPPKPLPRVNYGYHLDEPLLRHLP